MEGMIVLHGKAYRAVEVQDAFREAAPAEYAAWIERLASKERDDKVLAASIKEARAKRAAELRTAIDDEQAAIATRLTARAKAAAELAELLAVDEPQSKVQKLPKLPSHGSAHCGCGVYKCQMTGVQGHAGCMCGPCGVWRGSH